MNQFNCLNCNKLVRDKKSNRSVFCCLACRRTYQLDAKGRFLSFVKKTDHCWIWNGGKDRDGYGMFWYKGKTRRASVMAMILLENILVSGGSLCLHSCDNPSCVNPNHLFLGNQRDNIQDCLKKHRRDHVYPPLLRGEKNNHAILTREQVMEIRGRYSAGNITKRELANRYRVSHGNIKQIVAGRTWRWLINSDEKAASI